MAQKVTVVLSDDLDGSTADETVSFGLDDTSYEIDLSNDHAKQLRDTFGEYVEAARRSGGGRGRRSSAGAAKPATPPRSSSIDNTAIRTWAREAGLEVSDRGRIAASVREAYEAAH